MLYLSTKYIKDLVNSKNENLRRMYYIMQKNNWLKEFNEEKCRLNEEKFKEEFLLEAKKYNFRKKDFYKAHPAYSDYMSIKANKKGYIENYLTDGYVCILSSTETYVFNTLTEIVNTIGIDLYKLKDCIENNHDYYGIFFNYNDKIKYTNEQNILLKIKEHINLMKFNKQ